MKKFSLLLTSGLIIALITFFLLPIAVAQDPPLPPDIEGEWEFSISLIDKNWYGEKEIEVHSGTLEIVRIGPDDSNTEPNYFIDLPETDDDFDGFVHDGLFAFYKENLDNCGGPPDDNFGREMITGKIRNFGNKMIGKGMGFDSRPDCGGTWSYTFKAKKITE